MWRRSKTKYEIIKNSKDIIDWFYYDSYYDRERDTSMIYSLDLYPIDEDKESPTNFSIRKIINSENTYKRIECNRKCVKLFIKSLFRTQKTHEEFLFYFSYYNKIRGETATLKTKIIKMIKKKLNLIQEYLDFIKQNEHIELYKENKIIYII